MSAAPKAIYMRRRYKVHGPPRTLCPIATSPSKLLSSAGARDARTHPRQRGGGGPALPDPRKRALPSRPPAEKKKAGSQRGQRRGGRCSGGGGPRPDSAEAGRAPLPAGTQRLPPAAPRRRPPPARPGAAHPGRAPLRKAAVRPPVPAPTCAAPWDGSGSLPSPPPRLREAARASPSGCV